MPRVTLLRAGFTILPRRWVVERTFGWLMRLRRRVGDYERTETSAEAWVYIAMIRIQLRRLAFSLRNHDFSDTRGSLFTARAIAGRGFSLGPAKRGERLTGQHRTTKLSDGLGGGGGAHITLTNSRDA